MATDSLLYYTIVYYNVIGTILSSHGGRSKPMPMGAANVLVPASGPTAAWHSLPDSGLTRGL
eukprot:13441190-Heterocapsa_arctica.AAC.1